MLTVIVLGDRPDDGKPTEEMRRRVTRGIEISKERNADFIIFSGGRTSGKHSEALLMQAIAEEKGCDIPSILENRSLDTLGNAYFTALIIARLGKCDTVIVTGPSHIERAARLFSFVFGSEIEGISYGKHEAMSDSEKQAYEAATHLLDGIRPGDLDGIWQRMREMHPLYSDFS